MARSSTHAARNQAFRSAFTSIEAAQAAEPPTSTTITTVAERLKLPHCRENVPNGRGAKIHWIENLKAKKILLYFHGGGYAMGAQEGHVTFLYKSLQDVTAEENTVLAFLEYMLSAVEGWSLQLIQATEALRYLIEKKGYQAENIIIGGDSAGGHLTLALLSHIIRPFSTINKAPELNGTLKGALLISPWTSFETDTKSYYDFGETDIASPFLLKELADQLVPSGTPRDEWLETYKASAVWWKGLPVDNVLLVMGDSEVLHDHIIKVGQDLHLAGVNIKTVVCPKHVHIEAIIHAQTKFEEIGEMALAILD